MPTPRTRIHLHRPAPDAGAGPPVAWVGLNPSTADDAQDDPTVRRIRGFSQRAGFGDITLVNLYTLRATAPKDLYDALRQHPLKGRPTATRALVSAFAHTHVVLAWGRPANRQIARRAAFVYQLAKQHAADVLTIGPLLAGGHPRHPLYAAYRLGIRRHGCVE